MSFIKNFPQAIFTLPSGDEVVIVDIFKTFVMSDKTKGNDEILNKTHGVYTNKVENLSYELYGDKPSLYWTLLYLNDIDSFSSCPIPQSKFESNLSNRYPGKVYYIKDAIDASRIIKGDMVILFTVSGTPGVTAWRTAGIVKEYDSKFRRVVLEKEYENSGATTGFSGSNFYNAQLEVRRQNQGSWIPLGGSYEYNPSNPGLVVGRVEDETDMILGIYQDGLDGRDISPYQIVSGSDFTSSYDFAITGPTSGTVLYQITNTDPGLLQSPLSELYFHTLRKSEVQKNTVANSIKYLSVERAFTLNNFVLDMLKTSFRRGREITIT